MSERALMVLPEQSERSKAAALRAHGMEASDDDRR